jgi:murein DD-endopeptidase MepM/ murein hydrolase activator NlpD
LWPWTRQRASSPRFATNAGLLALALGAVGALGLAGAAGAPADEKARVDERLERAQQRLQRERAREQVLTDDVAAYTRRIRALEARLAPLRDRSARLEAELDSLRERLRALNDRLATERARLEEAEATLARRQELLGRRLRDLYVRGEPDPVLVLVESGSLAAAVEATDLVQSIANRDGALARSVSKYADETRATRDAIAEVRADVAASESRAQVAAEEAIAAKADLEKQRAGQTTLLAGRRALLSKVAGDREHIEAEAEGLAERSAALGNKIREAQGLSAAPSGSVATGSPSSSGMVWPVSGTLTSGFGPRWGRMHEGIDIAGGSGTPIGAAAAGTVILAGWNGGYGNMVVVDHGGGISTGYAHMSSISVSVGQSVGQGTVVGGMGTTGSSTGVHLHFEVRVNGAATNPLSYL